VNHKIQTIYCNALRRLSRAKCQDPLQVLTGGPAHVVWGDENFECAQWCIYRDEAGEFWHNKETPKEKKIVIESLK
jgi:hypothetical protein